MSKRANREGTVFKRKDGKWVAQIDLGTGDDGRRRRKTRIASRRADALAMLKSLHQDVEAGVKITRGDRLGDYLRNWLDTIVDSSAPNTIALYRNAIRNHVAPYLGGVAVDKLTAVQVLGLQKAWSDAGVGRRTQQVALSVLKQALDEAVRLGLTKANPAASVRKPRVERKKIDPFSVDEVKAILGAAKADQLHYAAVALMLATGMRFGEVAGLSWGCVDLKAGTVKVEQQATTDAATGRVVIRRVKTDRSERVIDLPQFAIDALVEHRAWTLKHGRAADELVFLGARGAMLANRNFAKRVWQPLLKSAGVRLRSIHHCRHTFATLALSEGVPLPQVSGILGHSRSSITLDIYSHWLPTHQKAARDTLSRVIG